MHKKMDQAKNTVTQVSDIEAGQKKEPLLFSGLNSFKGHLTYLKY